MGAAALLGDEVYELVPTFEIVVALVDRALIDLQQGPS
jgi:hypothetical protein